jgi:hypothetical protein
MHIEITLGMSLQVGLAFLTSLPMYIYGFTCSAVYGTGPWTVAAAICLGPTSLSVTLLQQQTPLLLPENWPLTPIKLCVIWCKC